jgi:hypothetical protein
MSSFDQYGADLSRPLNLTVGEVFSFDARSIFSNQSVMNWPRSMHPNLTRHIHPASKSTEINKYCSKGDLIGPILIKIEIEILVETKRTD